MPAVLAAETIDYGTIGMYLLGGLALFLFGMEQMTDALKMIAGPRMKSVLARLTTNRFKAAFAGAFVTSIIQSSSVTTVLVVGFISAGLLSLSQSIGIIMGANIGTTITAQVVAFEITHYSLLIISAGFGLLFFSKNEKLKNYGHSIMGLGMLFFGMEMMSNATQPLRSYEPFINAMKGMDNPIVGILIAAGFTAIVQSSSATTGLIIVLAKDGVISLEAGIALALGANVGTCITALLASIGKPREAVQAAVVHVLFNIVGVLLWVGLIAQLAWFVQIISPTATPQEIGIVSEAIQADAASSHTELRSLSAGELEQTARRSIETPRQIANAHTVFNILNTMLFIWFTVPLAVLVDYLIPKRIVSDPDVIRPKYLDDLLMQTPALALDIVRMELGRLGVCSIDMLRKSLAPVVSGTEQDLLTLERMDEDIDRLHGALITYLGRLSQETLSQSQSKTLYDYMATANYLENIGDMIETNLINVGSKRLAQNLQISQPTQDVLKTLHDKATWSVEHSLQALVEADEDKAKEVIDAKDEIKRLADKADLHVSHRLTATEPNRLVAFRIESEMVEYLKRVYYFARQIAKVVPKTEMELPDPIPKKEQESAG